MENSEKRPCPTGPGWWWIDGFGRRSQRAVVEVFLDGDELLWHDGTDYWLVEDDGRWLGPVPMPGEWAPRGLVDRLLDALSPAEGQWPSATSALSEARAWSNANPAPEETP